MKRFDLSGQVFHYLTVLSQVGSIRDKRTGHSQGAMWSCVCRCGKEVVVRAGALRRGTTKSCGCYIRSEKRKKRTPPGYSGLLSVYMGYKNKAGKAGREFSLTVESVKNITSQNCHYCGVAPSNKSETWGKHSQYFYNGIDRKNNDLGYNTDNCVPCCRLCNFTKGERLSYEEMMLLSPAMTQIQAARNYNKDREAA